MVVYLVVPLVPSIPSSSHPLTVMARLVSECLGFEKSLGFLKMVSGHLVVWLHHPEKGQLVLRYCITIFCKLF